MFNFFNSATCIKFLLMSRWIRLALEPPRLLSPPSLPATLLCSCGPCNLNWITFDQLSTFKWPCDIRVQYQSKFWILGVLELLGQHGFLIGFLIRNWNTQFLGFWHLDYSLDFRFLWCFLVFSTWLESFKTRNQHSKFIFSVFQILTWSCAPPPAEWPLRKPGKVIQDIFAET